jgi:hypothetical protein
VERAVGQGVLARRHSSGHARQPDAGEQNNVADHNVCGLRSWWFYIFGIAPGWIPAAEAGPCAPPACRRNHDG